VTQNYEEAARWFEGAAQAGILKAQIRLAHYNLEGMGMPRNPATALKWLEAASMQGDLDSLYQMGLIHKSKDSVAKGPVEAYYWLNLAAALGHREAVAHRNRIGDLLTPDELSTAQNRAAASYPDFARKVLEERSRRLNL